MSRRKFLLSPYCDMCCRWVYSFTSPDLCYVPSLLSRSLLIVPQIISAPEENFVVRQLQHALQTDAQRHPRVLRRPLLEERWAYYLVLVTTSALAVVSAVLRRLLALKLDVPQVRLVSRMIHERYLTVGLLISPGDHICPG